MDFIQAIVLGFVQGITEFIPISSSGHLVLTRVVFGWEDPGIAFDVILHLGTLIAVLIYFRKTWKRLVISYWLLVISIFKKNVRERVNEADKKLAVYLIIATIPAIIAGLFAENMIDEYFRSILWVSGFMIFTGIVFLFTEKIQKIFLSKKITLKKVDGLNLKDSIIIGLFQTIALFPGISRSGMTIVGGMLSKLKRESAARFAFLLSAPVILGAGVVGIIEIFKEKIFSDQWYYLLIGFLISAIVGYVSIAQLLKFLKKEKLNIFAYYLILVGAVLLIVNLG